MRAMTLEKIGEPLQMREREQPRPGRGEMLIRVHACGVCRTDLHVVDGDLPEIETPVVPGHQIVGRVEKTGEGVEGFERGAAVGVPWLGWTCGECEMCRAGRENLCPDARYTGCDLDGGFADFCTADARFCFPIPEGFPDVQAAPLLCAGLIGYRSYRMAGDAKRLGLVGFGSAAHILCQVAVADGREVYAFTKEGDETGMQFARELGAVWAGASTEKPPDPLDAAIIFAPVGELVPAALKIVKPGGTVVCAGIHMSDIPSFPYRLLWGERVLRSVANLTRRDGEEFLSLAPRAGVRTTVAEYPLERANDALEDLRGGRVEGSAVIVVDAKHATREDA